MNVLLKEKGSVSDLLKKCWSFCIFKEGSAQNRKVFVKVIKDAKKTCNYKNIVI